MMGTWEKIKSKLENVTKELWDLWEEVGNMGWDSNFDARDKGYSEMQQI